MMSLFIFFKYFSKIDLKTNSKTNIDQTIVDGESLIEDLKYLSTDKQGNEFRGLGMRAHVWRVDEEGRRQVLLDEDREEVAPPRSLASGVAQHTRGSNPGCAVT